MPPDLHRPCPLCGNRAPDLLGELSLPQPSHSPLPSGYRLVACTACDFVYADTPAVQADYDRYYQQLAKYGGPTGTGAGQNPADQRRLEQLADRLEALLPGRDAAILDIGCGAGGLLQVLHSRGYTRAEGLDPDPAAVAAARAQGLPVRAGLATESPGLYAGCEFKLIVLSHVAEHLRDLDWLDRLPRLLAPDGALYVEVPDPRGYDCTRRPPLYYFDSEHINHFSPRALARLFTRMGLHPTAFPATPLILSDGSPYPAFAGIATRVQRGIDESSDGNARCVDTLRGYLADSLQRSAASLGIQPPLGPGPVLVWGAGSWTQRLLGAGTIPLAQVRAFLDSAPNKQGQLLAGKPIVAPADGLSRHPDAQVLVCIAVNPHQIGAEVARLEPDRTRSLHFITEPT